MDNMNKLLGKTIIITGATSGIGLETAKGLAGMGALIIGVGRSQSKCSSAEGIIKEAYPKAKTAFLCCDLSSLKQVRELSRNICAVVEKDGLGHVDVLINNAGTVSSWYTSTQEGFELQFAVNYLAPFLLTHEVMHLLKKAPSGRVITVSSGSHYRTRINWDDIQLRRHYSCLTAYKQCKLADVVFTAELNRRLGPESTVQAFAVDPGLVNTDIGLKGTTGIERFVWARRSRGGIKPEEGAATSIYLASEASVNLSSGVYWKECHPKKPSSYSQREDIARRLWGMSEAMCGIKSGDYGISI